MKIIHFLGYRGSGKTSAIVALTKALSARGKRVGTLKHAHDLKFTVDARGKDTWRHAGAGASVVVGVAPGELAIIRKESTRDIGIDELFGIFSRNKVDYVLVEGFNRSIGGGRRVKRVLCARGEEDACSLLKEHPAVTCIVSGRGWKEPGDGSLRGIPVLNLPDDIQKLLKLAG